MINTTLFWIWEKTKLTYTFLSSYVILQHDLINQDLGDSKYWFLYCQTQLPYILDASNFEKVFSMVTRILIILYLIYRLKHVSDNQQIDVYLYNMYYCVIDVVVSGQVHSDIFVNVNVYFSREIFRVDICINVFNILT